MTKHKDLADRIEAQTPEWHYIDLFRIIRAAGRSDKAKAQAAAEYVANELRASQ